MIHGIPIAGQKEKSKKEKKEKKDKKEKKEKEKKAWLLFLNYFHNGLLHKLHLVMMPLEEKKEKHKAQYPQCLGRSWPSSLASVFENRHLAASHR